MIENRFSRRELVKRATTLAAGAFLDAGGSDIKKKFLDVAGPLGVDNIGYRISDPFLMDDLWHLAYQGILFRLDTDDTVNPVNTLDRIHARGSDRYLSRGTYGVVAPPHFDIDDHEKSTDQAFADRANFFGLPPVITDWIHDLRERGLHPGVPTSFPGDYGAFISYRFQRQTLQYWKDDGRIERGLVGHVAQGLGWIPESAALEKPLIDIPPPVPCLGQGGSEGIATYYSQTGCVGCSENQVMRNGEIFNENALTIAYMRAPLNSMVRVVNVDSGASVIARVTDWGGFEKYGLVADLSLAVKNAIGGSGKTHVKIVPLECT